MSDRNPFDSPFLDEVSFGAVTGQEQEALAEDFFSESPFQTALEASPSSERESAPPDSFEASPASEQETGIINGDNRVRITNTTAVPFRWICRIDVQDARGRLLHGGTGVLVSDRHVLTAAHVIHEAAANMQSFSIQVRPALDYGNEPFGSYTVSATPKIPRHYRRAATDSLDWDYALLTLGTRIGTKAFAKLNGKALSYWGSPHGGANSVFARPDPKTLNGKSAFTAGYPRSAGGQKLLCASGILVSVAAKNRTMRITADATEGQSGSPVWIVENGRCCLVGVAAAAGQHLNVVVRVTRELVRQVRTWISEDGDTPSMVETEEPLESPSIALTQPESEADESGGDQPGESASDEERPEDLEGEAGTDPDQELGFESSDDEAIAPELEAREEGEEEEEDGWSGDLEARATDPDADPEADVPSDSEEEGQATDDDELEIDMEHLLDYDVPPAATTPTLGFEFDLNYGFEQPVATAKGLTPPAGWRWPSEGLRVTDHEAKTSAGDWKDAIHVSMDAVRMEIASAPIRVNDDEEFNRVVKAVLTFGQELIDAPKKREVAVTVPDFGGHPTTFTHPRTVVNKPEVDGHGTVKFPGDAEHASYTPSSVPLVIHRVSGSYPTQKQLWASPQATLTLPLSEFGSLVWQIHTTKGGAPGVALTGRSGDRLGVRDDLAWLALTRAVADRKKRIGAPLSDGTTVTEADFTRSITSLVTILVMYMLTGVMKDPRDESRESFAKGSLPLNVKTPLWQIHKFALTSREKFVFKELYGATDKRARLYELAKPGADGSYELFPEYTRWDPERFFTTAPTWETLVEAVVDEKPMTVAKDNRVPKKKHQKGDEILIASLSSKIVWDKTKPLIAVEMRRIGFAPVHFEKWGGLMKRLRELARKVNP